MITNNQDLASGSLLKIYLWFSQLSFSYVILFLILIETESLLFNLI